MSSLWGVVLSASKPHDLEVPEDRDLIVTRAALVGESAGANVLSVKNGDQTLVLGTLRSNGTEQFELDLNISAGSTLGFLMTGPNQIHLIGYYNLVFLDGESYDSDSGEGYEGPFDLEGYESASDEDFSGNVEDVSDSSQDEMDEDGENPSPVKSVTFAKRPNQTASSQPSKKQKTGEAAAKVTASSPKEPKHKEVPKKEAPKKEAPKKEAPKKESPKPAPKPAPKESPKPAPKEAPKPQKAQQSPKGGKEPEKPAAALPATPGKTQQVFPCTVAGCGKKFKSETGLQSHVDTKHK